tara:strand:+ start:75 stop:575 length:501 start_codon:yes stop_codon:yes gene_type:complete
MDNNAVENLKGLININEHAFKVLNKLHLREVQRVNGDGEFNETRNIRGEKSTQDLNFFQILPSMILACLTVELLIKLLIFQKTGVNRRGHNLSNLFDFLPDEIKDSTKERFRTELDIEETEFNSTLDNNSNLFVEGRYAHEGTEDILSGEPKFIIKLFSYLKEHVE